MRTTWQILIPVLLLSLGFIGVQGLNQQDREPASQLTPLSQRFDPDTQPYAFVLPHMPAPASVSGIRAEDCGKCHETIYQEWKNSTHAHALSDLQFQAELAKEGSPRWLCLNCHIPLQDQRAEITLGLEENQVMKPVQEPNPQLDPVLRQEAITCAACHLRLDEKGKSYILGPNGSEQAPHPVRKDPNRLRSICLRCHDPVGGNITPNLFCWFTTRAELVEGGGKETDCSSCHMPVQERRLSENWPDLPIRKVHRHTWPGGGIPKTYAGYDRLLIGGWKSGLAIRARRTSGRVILTLSNDKAGHSVPTADPERSVQIHLRAFDDQGEQIWEAKERIGQTWTWNPARKLGENRIRPGESREIIFEPPASARLVLDVLNVRLSKSSAEHMVKTENLDEQLLPHANQMIKELGRLYPFATYIHRVTWTGEKGSGVEDRGQIAEPEILLELSRKESLIPIAERSY
jgi:nitrate reductase cytochrome c-type subunit